MGVILSAQTAKDLSPAENVTEQHLIRNSRIAENTASTCLETRLEKRQLLDCTILCG
jgi:hypothetical protein